MKKETRKDLLWFFKIFFRGLKRISFGLLRLGVISGLLFYLDSIGITSPILNGISILVCVLLIFLFIIFIGELNVG